MQTDVKMFTVRVFDTTSQELVDEFSAFGSSVEEILETFELETKLVLVFKE